MKQSIITLLLFIPVVCMSQSSFQQDLAMMLNANSEKVIGLAEAIPEEHYSWSPAEGIRSVQDVVVHIIGANYFFAQFAGVKPPEGINPMELSTKITTKEQSIQGLNDSYAFIKDVVSNIPDAKLEEKIDFFGQEMTVRAAMIVAFGHCEEHMGQLIAYARANDVTPPWSQSE